MKLKGLVCSICLALLLPLAALPAGAAVKETDGGIFYRVENGEIIIEGFNDVGSTMKVPEEIDGYPVRHIASYACRGNTVLTEVHLPSTLVSVGEFAFADCTNLRKVILSGGSEIGFSAFRNCSDLKKLSLPDTLVRIDDFAFESCVLLGKVKIPASVTVIGVDAFAGCGRLLLDVSENPMAKEYAHRYAIPTSFTETWEFTVLMASVIALLGGGCLLLVFRLEKKRKFACKKQQKNEG